MPKAGKGRGKVVQREAELALPCRAGACCLLQLEVFDGELALVPAGLAARARGAREAEWGPSSHYANFEACLPTRNRDFVPLELPAI
jgi:hypothetical protein